MVKSRGEVLNVARIVLQLRRHLIVDCIKDLEGSFDIASVFPDSCPPAQKAALSERKKPPQDN